MGAFDTSERACLALPFEATSAGPTRPTRENPEGRHKPDLSAPGVNIVAARAQKGTIVMSGTSMATAHVTGLVAILYDLALRSGRGFLPFDELRRILVAASQSSDSKGWDPQLGECRIDGTLSVESLLDRQPAPAIVADSAPAPISLDLKPGIIPAFMEAFSSMMSKIPLPSNGNGNGSDSLQKIRQAVQFTEDKLQNGEGVRLTIDSLE